MYLLLDLFRTKDQIMYLKKVKVKDYVYLKFVETVWDKQTQKRSQKTVLNLGRLDVLIDNGLPSIVKNLANVVNQEMAENLDIKNDNSPMMVDLQTVSEAENCCYGHIIYRKLWNVYQFSDFFEHIKRNSKINFNLTESAYLMVINQLLRPCSKLKLHNENQRYFGVKEVELQHFYRTLDVLADEKQNIENYVFAKNKNLFNQNIDIVFYDVTTFYFESQKADDLKDFGFDKDNKINNVHVVMGLLIDRTGKPIGYELFKGNTYEGHTLLASLEKLRKRFNINTVIIVADKGLNSKANLLEIRNAGYHYIVSGRLKSMKTKVKEQVFRLDDYHSAQKNEFSFFDCDDDKNKFLHKTLDYKNEIRYKEKTTDKYYKKVILDEQLICTYSSKRATKDRKDRERLLEKALEIIDNNEKSKLENHKGHKKYVSKKYQNNEKCDNYEIVLNQEKIIADEQYDGFYVIQSSNPNLTATEVIENYHYLYKIEESFRIMKSTMEVRPIKHWTPKRIEGHFAMCFIAFLLERELELRLLNNKKVKAPMQIQTAINSLEFTKLTIESNEVFIKSKNTALASQIMNVLKIKQPENLSTAKQAENYVKEHLDI